MTTYTTLKDVTSSRPLHSISSLVTREALLSKSKLFLVVFLLINLTLMYP